MEPTSDPDNTRQSRGLARFWPVHGMPAPAQRQSEEDLDASEGADGAAAAHASDQLAGVAGPTGEHPQVSDRQSQPQDEQHPADEPAPGPFAPGRPHPSLTSDTQMVALGSRRPADALLGGANGSRWSNQGGFPQAETNGHRNGEAAPRHGGAPLANGQPPMGSGPIGGGPVGNGPVPGSRSPFAPVGDDAPFSPGQFLPQAHGSATVNGGNAQPPAAQPPVAQPPVAQPPVAQRPAAQASHPLAPIDLPAGPDLFAPAQQPPAGARPVSGQPASGSAQVPIPMTGRPVSAQPVSGQPTSGQPLSGQPLTGQPLSGQLLPGQPLPDHPMSGRPVSGQPMSGQPMSGQPMSDHPMSSGQPMSGQPMSGQPWSGQPRSSQGRSGQAEAEQPPAARAIPLEAAVPTRLEPTGWATPSPLSGASGSIMVPAGPPSGGRRSRDDDPADTRVPAPRRSTSLDDVSAEPGGRRAARAAESDATETPLRPGDLRESSITFWEEAASEQFRAEWHEIKAQFVDDPVTALTRAHDLLTEAVHELTESMLAERDELDPLRGKGTPDTESMRMAMRGYREFLDRILTL